MFDFKNSSEEELNHLPQVLMEDEQVMPSTIQYWEKHLKIESSRDEAE